MIKEKKNLLICLGIIVVLLGAYFFLTQKTNAEDISTNVATDGYITNYSQLKATKLAITNGEETTVYFKNGIDWEIENNSNIEIVQIAIDQLIAFAKNLEYVSVVSETLEEASNFGINPERKISVSGDDGTNFTLLVGDITSDATGYYVALEGDSRIFLINAEAGEAISKLPDSFRNRYPEYVDYNNSKYILVEHSDGKSYTIEPNLNGALTEGYGEYVVAGYYKNPMPLITTELTQNIGGPLYEIAALTFIDNPQELSVYGLDVPSLIITAEDNSNNKCVIEVGSQANENSYYAKFSGKDYVCTISKARVDSIKDVNMFNAIGKYLVNTAATEVTSITVSHADVNANFSINQDDASVIYNGNLIDTLAFSGMFQKLSALTMDGEAFTAHGEEGLTVTIKTVTGEQETLKFFEYDHNFYAVEKDGIVEFITGKRAVELFLNSIKDLG